MTLDGKCVSTSDLDVTENIDRIRNYHLNCQANTPFTRSPCIIPITHACLWNPQGFTISLWLQAKGSQNHKSTSQITDDDNRSASDVYMVRFFKQLQNIRLNSLILPLENTYLIGGN